MVHDVTCALLQHAAVVESDNGSILISGAHQGIDSWFGIYLLLRAWKKLRYMRQYTPENRVANCIQLPPGTSRL